MGAPRLSCVASAQVRGDGEWTATSSPWTGSTTPLPDFCVAETTCEEATMVVVQDVLDKDLYTWTVGEVLRAENESQNQASQRCAANAAFDTSFCTSCKRNRDTSTHFVLGRKTCRECLERHKVNAKRTRVRAKLFERMFAEARYKPRSRALEG